MPLVSTLYTIEVNPVAAGSGLVTSTSRTYNIGELVVVNYGKENAVSPGALSITNSGTAQTWNLIDSEVAASEAPTAAWYCVMSVTQAMTVSCSLADGAAGNNRAWIAIEKCTGQNIANPVPSGNRFSGAGGTDISQAITPTSTGSALRMWASDYTASNTFAAATNCTLIGTNHVAGAATVAWIRPTTDPRPDAAAFTIGETDTAGQITWLAYEIQAEPDTTMAGPPMMARRLTLDI